MGDTKQTTKDVSGLSDFLIDTKTYETTVTDGKDSVSSRAGSPEKSREQANEKWDKK